MNVFKFFGTDGRYAIAVPHRNKWLVLEEGRDGLTFEYRYVPNFGKDVCCYIDGKKHIYIYGDKALHLRHCTFKWLPSWVVGSHTI